MNHQMKLTILILILSLLVIGACSSDSSKPTPDIPSVVGDTESIANVQTRMKTLDHGVSLFSAINNGIHTCHQAVEFFEGWSDADARYFGDGVWLVTVGNWRWEYYETTGAILSSHTAELQRLSNC